MSDCSSGYKLRPLGIVFAVITGAWIVPAMASKTSDAGVFGLHAVPALLARWRAAGLESINRGSYGC
jgi:hypothetical protein